MALGRAAAASLKLVAMGGLGAGLVVAQAGAVAGCALSEKQPGRVMWTRCAGAVLSYSGVVRWESKEP